MTTAVEQSVRLPPLREDLQLLQGPSAHNGAPTWNIYDPICNKFFRIGWSAFQLISRWRAGTVKALLARIASETTAQVDDKDVEALIKFLHSNNLTRDSASGSSSDYLAQYLATRPKWYIWLVKNYLFIRIPLFQPRRFFAKTMPLVEVFFSKYFVMSMLVIGLLGLYLVARQWESFLNTFSYFFNLKGAVFYFIALIFIKVMHELGHAYTATRYGSKVASMGIAMLVMLPVLYTDTTDAWRINSRNKRVLIGMGGMLVELYLAVIFTFLWNFLPDGMFRSAAFVVATTSWIMSLAINLNILMRFDGYYILSDLLGVENLQHRSFALGKWKLRELLFDLGRPPPGNFPGAVRRKLVLYAWSVWIYRFFLFLGIALLVYHFFFKVLGVLLFAVEMLWFIILPVRSEIREWTEMKEEIRQSRRYRLTTFIGFIILSLFFIPWHTRITTPAVLQAVNETGIYSGSPGFIKEIYVKPGDEIRAGEALLVLESPSLENEITRTAREHEVTELRSQRRASNLDDLANMQVVLQQLQELQSRLDGLYEMKEQLTIRSPIDGSLVDMAEDLHSGRWINTELRLAYVARLDDYSLQGVIEGKKLSQVEVGQQAVFIPDEPELETIDARVIEIGKANIQVLDILYFASLYGGDIAVREDEDNALVPEESLYRIRYAPLNRDRSIARVIRGKMHIKGEPRSFAFRTYDLIATVLIRESGF